MFSLSGAIIAGFLATALMTISMYSGKVMGLSMDMPRALGLTFVNEDSRALYVVGLIGHFVMGCSFAVLYALIFWLVGATRSVGALAAWGVAVGAIHGLSAGVVMGRLPQFHPRTGEGLAIEPPGYFGRNYGMAMPLGMVFLHLIFGGVLGVVYGLLVL